MRGIYKDTESGQWVADVRKKGFPRQRRYFRTKAMAEDWKSETIAAMKKGDFVDAREAQKTPFSAVADSYIKELEALSKNARVDLDHIEDFKKQGFYSKAIGLIKAPDLIAYRDDMNNSRGLAAETIHRRFTTIRAIYTHAKNSMHLLVSFPSVQLPKKGDSRVRIFVDDEHERFFEAAPKYGRGVFHLVAEFAIETTMRKAEIVGMDEIVIVNGKKQKQRKHDGLLWRMVHTDKRILKLPGSITKTGKPRDVPLSSRAIEIIESVRPKKPKAADKVFDISPDGVRNAHRRTCAAAGISDFWFRDLRHVGCTKWAQVLMPLELMKLTGHKDLRMLSIYYNEEASSIADKMR